MGSKKKNGTAQAVDKPAPSGMPAVQHNGIKKEYSKNGTMCKVTFRLPGDAACDATRVAVVGDFNSWDASANPMKKLKSGEYTACIGLDTGREYQFRYLIDEMRWENDRNADKYVRSPYGDSDNSVIVV